MGDRDHPHVAARELCVELIERDLAAGVDLEVAQLRAALAAEDLPGDDVRVVLHLRDQHRVAGTDVRPAPGIRDEVDRLGDVLGEDRRLRLCSDERGDPFACAVVRGVGLLRQRVDAAVHVRVVLAQVIRERLDHDLGLLRGRARIQVDQRAPVETAGEDREV